MVPEKVKENLLSEENSPDTNSQFAMEALIANNKYRVKQKSVLKLKKFTLNFLRLFMIVHL